MSVPQERADHEVVGNKEQPVLEGIEQPLTPLQFHYLSLLQRLIAVKNSYQTDPDFEGARQTVQLIAVLQDKTSGNLDDEESRLLESFLVELRLKTEEAKKRQKA